jgi:hypothetical protein
MCGSTRKRPLHRTEVANVADWILQTMDETWREDDAPSAFEACVRALKGNRFKAYGMLIECQEVGNDDEGEIQYCSSTHVFEAAGVAIREA